MSTDRQKELQAEVFGDKDLRQNLRDIIARNNTGYNYEELKEAITTGEDGLEDDELESIDKTVNILSHLISYIGRAVRIDELEGILAASGFSRKKHIQMIEGRLDRLRKDQFRSDL
jgi:hypothetical protein